MTKKEYAVDSFGAYFVKLIKDHNYSQAKFAADLGISKTYLFDVFNGRVKPPTSDMQECIVELLRLLIRLIDNKPKSITVVNRTKLL